MAKYPDIRTANQDGTPYYTNSSHLPVGYTDDIFSALDIQDELQTLYTSGTVFHAFLGEKLPDWEAAAKLVRKIAENYKLPYYTLSPTYSVCKEHGYLVGEQPTCPHCGEKAEVYSRITGYYRPVQNWNAGKSQEYKDRKEYVVCEGDSCSITNPPTTAKEAPAATPAPEAEAPAAQATDARVMLFTTKTCPNCRTAIAHMDKVGFVYEKMMAHEHMDLVKAFGISLAPTLVIQTADGFTKYEGAGAVIQYVKSQKV